MSSAASRCSPASGPDVTRSGSLLLSRVTRPGSPLLYVFRFQALCPPPADPMLPTQGLVLVYLPLLGVVFPISGPQYRGEIGASVPRPRSLSLFRLPPLVVGIRCSPCRASHDAPPHPGAVSHVIALAITAKGRGACNTTPASRATPFLTLASTTNMGYLVRYTHMRICLCLALRVVCRGVSVHPLVCQNPYNTPLLQLLPLHYRHYSTICGNGGSQRQRAQQHQVRGRVRSLRQAVLSWRNYCVS